MAIQHNYIFLHLSLSRRFVADLPRQMTNWAPIEFYAAIEGMHSAEGCMNGLGTGDMALSGWRLFSSSHRTEGGEVVQWVREVERLFIRAEAIAYARTAAREKFVVNAPLKNWSKYQEVPQELLDRLGGAA